MSVQSDTTVYRDRDGVVYKDKRGNVLTAFHRMPARESFPILRKKLLASRPVAMIIDEGQPTQKVIYGKPTFRNVINEAGEHV